jgi:hypothetical protein
MMNANATLAIRRTHQWANRARAIKLFLNGESVGTILDGETKEFPVTPGEVTVTASIDWCAAEPLAFMVPAGTTKDIELGCNFRGFLQVVPFGFIAGLYWFVLNRKNCLYLRNLDP